MLRTIAHRAGLIGAAISFSAATAYAAGPPPAPSEPVTDTFFGVRVDDPYRNLENVKTPQTQAWFKAQAEYGEAILSRIAIRDEMAQRVAELGRSSGDLVREVVRMPGEAVLVKASRVAGLDRLAAYWCNRAE